MDHTTALHPGHAMGTGTTDTSRGEWTLHQQRVMGRQPIVDGLGEVVAFKLLYGAGSEQDESDAEILTVDAMLSTPDADVNRLVGDRMVFCDVDRHVLTGETALTMPRARTVLEIHPSVVLDKAVREGIRRRKHAGYRIAVQGRSVGEYGEALLELADLVKVDVRGTSRARVDELVDACVSQAVTPVAECCTTGDLDWALGAGFTLFQGHALLRPDHVGGPDLSSSALTQARLASELLKPDLDFDQVEAILRPEPGLVVQLLRMAGRGAGSGLRREVRSLREALIILGVIRIRQWAAIAVLGRQRSATADALTTALVRARMCELLAQRERLDGGSAFTAGLLSALDLLLGVDLAEVERRLDIDEALAAVAFRGKTPLGALVRRVVDYQDAVGGAVTRPFGDLELVGAMAFCWATALVTAMNDTGAGG